MLFWIRAGLHAEGQTNTPNFFFPSCKDKCNRALSLHGVFFSGEIRLGVVKLKWRHVKDNAELLCSELEGIDTGCLEELGEQVCPRTFNQYPLRVGWT